MRRHSWKDSKPYTLTLGVFQRRLTLILLEKHRDTNGKRIVIQIGGVYTTFCQKEGILLRKYRDRTGRWIAILFNCIGVRGRFDSPENRVLGSSNYESAFALCSFLGGCFWLSCRYILRSPCAKQVSADNVQKHHQKMSYDSRELGSYILRDTPEP